jgi:hypothetical protein
MLESETQTFYTIFSKQTEKNNEQIYINMQTESIIGKNDKRLKCIKNNRKYKTIINNTSFSIKNNYEKRSLEEAPVERKFRMDLGSYSLLKHISFFANIYTASEILLHLHSYTRPIDTTPVRLQCRQRAAL